MQRFTDIVGDHFEKAKYDETQKDLAMMKVLKQLHAKINEGENIESNASELFDQVYDHMNKLLHFNRQLVIDLNGINDFSLVAKNKEKDFSVVAENTFEHLEMVKTMVMDILIE